MYKSYFPCVVTIRLWHSQWCWKKEFIKEGKTKRICLLKLTKLHMSAEKENSVCEAQRRARASGKGTKCAVCIYFTLAAKKSKYSDPRRNIIRSLYQMVYGSLLEYTAGFMSCVTGETRSVVIYKPHVPVLLEFMERRWSWEACWLEAESGPTRCVSSALGISGSLPKLPTDTFLFWTGRHQRCLWFHKCVFTTCSCGGVGRHVN